MPEPEKRRNVLLYLAAEGVIPVLGGCAGALAGGPVAGLAGVAVGKAVEKAINLFGQGIVDRWGRWFARNPEEAQAAVAELAALPPAEAREEAQNILRELAPDANEEDLLFAVEFLSAIPLSADRALVPDPAGGGRTVPPTVTFDDPRSLLQLLPEDVPPYPASAELPGTPYRLVELLGAGGFGAVYRAVSPTLQHLPLAIKFCLDRTLLPALNQERSNLERLMRAGGPGSRHVVRLYGYDLDHATPYLVYEFVEGGDLTRLVAARRAALGRPPDHAEVLGWVIQVAEGLAFAHRAGLVHRDLKPANVLVGRAGEGPSAGVELRLADFGLGGVTAARVAARSRIGTSTIDYLSLAEQASLFRGAGTPLYMSPEQRRGAPPDARHDLYALGVVWYQLLVGDVSRELHHGWAKELAVRFGVPSAHIALIERCVGWFDERPKDASELLPLLKEAGSNSPATAGRERESRLPFAADISTPPQSAADTALNASQVTPTPQATSGYRRSLLVSMVAKLDAAYAKLAGLERWRPWNSLIWGFPVGLVAGWLTGELYYVEAYSHSRSSFPNAFRPVPFEWPPVLLGILVGLLVWAVCLVVSWGVARARREYTGWVVAYLGDELAREFPAQVVAWGGLVVLRDAGIVRRLRDELTPPAPAPAPASTPTPDDITADQTPQPVGPLSESRRRGASALLGRLDAAYTELAELAGWRFGTTALSGALLVIGVGGPFAALVITTAYPGDRDSFTQIAVALAPLFWIAYVVFVRRRAKKTVEGSRARAEALVEEIVGEFPAEVASWGGRAALRHPPTVRRLLQELDPAAAAPAPASGPGPEDIAADPTRRALLVARLKEHAQLLKDTKDNSDLTWAGLVFLWAFIAPGIGGICGMIPFLWDPGGREKTTMLLFGLIGGSLAVAAFWWAMAALRHRLARAREAGIDRFAADYPRLVEVWGGRRVLESPEPVAALLKTIDPAAEPGRRGFFRRLFGG